MKILFVVPSYKPAFVYGGPIRSIAALAESLVIAGHSVTVYTTTANGNSELNVDPGKTYWVDGVEVNYFRRLTKGHSHISISLIMAFLKKLRQFDIIHIHSWWNFITVPIALLSLSLNRVPIISLRGTLTAFTFSTGHWKLKRIFHQAMGRFLLERSLIHVTSSAELTESKVYIPKATISCLPNLLQLSAAITEQKHSGIFTILFLGRIDKSKNLETIIDAVRNGLSFPFQFEITGQGQSEYEKALMERTREVSEIKWIGEVDGREKFEWLRNADLLVLPSHIENFGNVIIEALSQGTAVAVSANVGSGEYLLKNNLGWVVSGGAQEWKIALEQIHLDQQKLNSIRLNAPKYIQEDFNPVTQVQQYIQLYNEHAGFNTVNAS